MGYFSGVVNHFEATLNCHQPIEKKFKTKIPPVKLSFTGVGISGYIKPVLSRVCEKIILTDVAKK